MAQTSATLHNLHYYITRKKQGTVKLIEIEKRVPRKERDREAEI
jgi:hypothetical protein